VWIAPWAVRTTPARARENGEAEEVVSRVKNGVGAFAAAGEGMEGKDTLRYTMDNVFSDPHVSPYQQRQLPRNSLHHHRWYGACELHPARPPVDAFNLVGENDTRYG